MKEKLPNSEWCVYLDGDKVRLEIIKDNVLVKNKSIFNFHELIMLWFWTDDQINRYFSTRKLIEGMADWSYTAYK